MKKIALITGLSFVFLSSTLSITTTSLHAQDDATVGLHDTSGLAPADAYFGRFRLSILGMRNTIRDVALRVDSASSDDLDTLFHKLITVEDAVGDLRDQYPHDTWLPQLGLSLARAFQKMPIPRAQAHANDALDWVIADYPNSDEAYYANAARGARPVPVATRAIYVPVPVPVYPAIPSYAVPLPR